MTVVGTSARRLEDARLIRGRGRFVDDVDLPNQVWARVVRASAAHADLRRIDTSAALEAPGVVTVVTGADVADLPRIPIRLRWAEEPDHALQPVLAQDRVRYVGEPVAVVVAETPYQAEDAADRVEVDYGSRDAILDAVEAVMPNAASLWDGGGNEVETVRVSYGDNVAAFERADEVVELDLVIGRHSAVPIETRGLVARCDRMHDRLEIWGWTKVPHYNRQVLADMLGIPLSSIRLHSVDAGGGFGIRGEFYPEDMLVPWLAWRLGRPIKWVEDRSEHLVSANHSRHQHHRVAGAFSSDGALLALRAEVWHDNGAYLRTHGITVPELTAKMLPGPYDVGAYEATVHVVSTNKTPCGTYRGPGRYEVTFVREQLLNVAADRLGIDRITLRRRNLVSPDAIPYVRPINVLGGEMVLSSGDYPALLTKTLERAGFAAWEQEAAAARAGGRLVGTGVAIFLEKSGLGPYETAEIQVDRSGRVQVLTGGASLGQGIETVLGQIAADELGVSLEDVEVVHGETDLIPDGVGSWASRSTVVGGSAVHLAARDTAEQARRVGAELLGVTDAKVELAGGHVVVKGTTDRAVSLGKVAAACIRSDERHEGRGLGASRSFSVERMNYPYGVHLAQVEIEPTTAGVRVLRYFVGYEVGHAINPQLVEGQLVGGVAQGLGGALLEEFTYDEAGQPLATTFIDYLMPTAAEMPDVGTLISEDAPPPDNPLGVMGSGEGGCTGVGAAIAGAVSNALGDASAVRRLPVTPSDLLEHLVERKRP